MRSLIVSLICLNILCVSGYLKEKEREMARHLLTECKVTEGGSDADYEKLVHEELPETKEGNCMIACAYETIGIVSLRLLFVLQRLKMFLCQFNRGKFSNETFMHIAKMIVENDEKMMSQAAVIAEQCGKCEGERCEQAYAFTKCVHDAISTAHVDVQLV